MDEWNNEIDYVGVELGHTQELIEYAIWLFSTNNDEYDGPEFQ